MEAILEELPVASNGAADLLHLSEDRRAALFGSYAPMRASQRLGCVT